MALLLASSPDRSGLAKLPNCEFKVASKGRWMLRTTALLATSSLICCGEKKESGESRETKPRHPLRESADSSRKTSQGDSGRPAMEESAPSIPTTVTAPRPENHDDPNSWEAISQTLYRSSDEWRKCGNDITLAEQWFKFKNGIKERIQQMEPSPSIAAIERQMLADRIKETKGADFAKEFPALANLPEADARLFLDRWGKAAGLSPDFTRTVMTALGTDAGPETQPSPSDFQTAQATVHPMVDSYYKGAIANVLRMAEQEALIRSQASPGQAVARESYSAAQAERFSKPIIDP
ncbi:hypothetical protein [Luteolibacter luteus]|uniref:Uncharacterized protein n=1 Tax=Luteolibacter luteus TaxID=2728835 RepID=A0A858RKB5_9BACT|nr:hypothetical protein [Luteolibacter luteus]QJE96944.1 hypothetical protein HHL09_14490 [Luteolibacter luteus]